MRTLTKVLRKLDQNIEYWALLFFYALLVITMAVEVVRREVFQFSSIWGEEIVRYAFIYLVWIGASAGVRDRAHIRIDVILSFLSMRSKTILYIFGDITMLCVALIAVYWSWDTVAISWKFGSVTDGLRISKVWFLMAVPFGFALVIIRLLQSLNRDIQAFLARKDVFEGTKLFD